ncbi:MAG: tellurite resistance TerB C-terminal domain-containing protein [Agriterribacter sp.]
MNGLLKSTVLFVLLALSWQPLFSQEKYRAESDANLRSGPSTDFGVLSTIKAGEEVEFVDSGRGNWLKVKYGVKEGYVAKKLFLIVPPPIPTVPIADTKVATQAPPVDSTTTTQKWLIVLGCVVVSYFVIARKGKRNNETKEVATDIARDSQFMAPESINHTQKAEKTGEYKTLKKDDLPLPKIDQQISIDEQIAKEQKVIKGGAPINSTIAKETIDSALVDVKPAISKKELPDTGMKIPSSSNLNEGVIDISNIELNLAIAKEEFTNAERSVPYWEHQYIYSFDNLRWANDEQRKYYDYFKQSFLSGRFPNTGENTNYSFLLLFDLIRDYESHRDLNRIQNELDILALHYPRTKIYTYTTLAKTLLKLNDHDSINILLSRGLIASQARYGSTSESYSFTADFWGLGTRFKQKLKLEDHEVELLNRLWHTQNTFSDIEFCHMEIVKLFVRTIKFLVNRAGGTGPPFDNRLNEMVNLILIKHFHFTKGSYNYKSSIDSVKNEIYNLIYKICENAVRARYEHKRKLSEDFYITKVDIKAALEKNILSPVSYAILQLTSLIESPDPATEVELNAKNPSRWKNKFEQYLNLYKHAPEQFVTQIYQLGKDNSKNPSVENIFFEASKAMSAVDKNIALQLYVHYIYADLNSETFDHRKLTKTIQKSLFKSEDQLKGFEVLINELIKTKDLEAALSRVNELFLTKRKKIKIDKDLIKEVQTQHSETVELLNEVLQDDDEQEPIGLMPKQEEDVVLKIDEAPEQSLSNYYIADISFSPVHFSFLQLFEKNNFLLSDNEITPFAKSNGVFQNSLIDNINELCYEFFDDNLIEQEDLNYSINPSQYKRLLQQ